MTLFIWLAEAVNMLALAAAVLEYRATSQYLLALRVTGRNGKDRLAALARRRRHGVRVLMHLLVATLILLPAADRKVDVVMLPRGWQVPVFIAIALALGINTLSDRKDRIRIVNHEDREARP